MAAGAQRSTSSVCADETTLVTDIAQGAGKCMPAIAKTREDTGRPACGPEHSWPPDRVSSRQTMAMPRVTADELKARLYVFPEKQVATNLTALRMTRPTPSQRKKDLVPAQPWVEPLVRQHSSTSYSYYLSRMSSILVFCGITCFGDFGLQWSCVHNNHVVSCIVLTLRVRTSRIDILFLCFIASFVSNYRPFV